MEHIKRIAAAAAVAALIAAGAWGLGAGAMAQSGAHHGQNGHVGHGAASGEAADNPAVQAFKEANARMHEGMAIEFTGSADVDFARGMIPHHQGAIDMARIVLKHGSDPEIRKLAQEIIAAQESGIAFLEKWLERRKAR